METCTGAPSDDSITASGGAVGEELCITIVINDEMGEVCCSTELCVVIPDCSQPASACDLDGDGVVGTGDLFELIGSWGACGDCDRCAGDFNTDCWIGAVDLLTMLADWG